MYSASKYTGTSLWLLGTKWTYFSYWKCATTILFYIWIAHSYTYAKRLEVRKVLSVSFRAQWALKDTDFGADHPRYLGSCFAYMNVNFKNKAKWFFQTLKILNDLLGGPLKTLILFFTFPTYANRAIANGKCRFRRYRQLISEVVTSWSWGINQPLPSLPFHIIVRHTYINLTFISNVYELRI